MSKELDSLKSIDHLNTDRPASHSSRFQMHALKAAAAAQAPGDQPTQVAQPLRGSFRLRRRSLAGDEAAAAELAASISALSHSRASENSAAAHDVEHLREAKDQHDGSYTFNYRETQAGYYRAIVLCAGRAIRNFIVLIEPGRLEPTKCFVGGPCFETTDPGRHALQVELYDAYGNAAPWPTNPGVKVVVKLENNRGLIDAMSSATAAREAQQRGGVAGDAVAAHRKPSLSWKRAKKIVSIAEIELTEPPAGGLIWLPMTRSGRYIISVTFKGEPLGDMHDTSITGQLNAKPNPFREAYISAFAEADTHTEAELASNSSLDVRADDPETFTEEQDGPPDHANALKTVYESSGVAMATQKPDLE